MNILQHDQSETWPRIRRTVIDQHGIEVSKLRSDIPTGIVFHSVDLWTYVRPSNGQRVWLIEDEVFCPPDAVVYEGWVVDSEPTDAQIIDIITTRARP